VKRTGGFAVVGLFVALILAGLVSNVASDAPDGLDSASTHGCAVNAVGEIVGGTCMAQGAKEHEVNGPFADYAFTGVRSPLLSTAVSGVLGVLATFALAGGLFWLARRRDPGVARGARVAPDPRAGPPARAGRDKL
jgi:cobalt/nickel transport protein